MKIRKVAIFACVTIFTLVGLSIFTTAKNEDVNEDMNVVSRYNMNTDNSQKVIGSKKFRQTASMIPSESLNDLLSLRGNVIIGQVMDEPVTREYTIGVPVEFKEKLAEDQYNHMATSEMAYTTIQVEEVIYGNDIDKDAKTIQFVQPGLASDDNFETKVKKGNRVLLFLEPFMSEENTYQTTYYEESIFYLEDLRSKRVLTSCSDEHYVAKYDGIELKTLIEDLKETDKVKDNIEHFYE